MSYFPVCPAENITLNPDNTLSCSTGWQLHQSEFPFREMTPGERGEIMAAIALFLAVCFVGKIILRFMTTPTSISND